MSALRLVAVIGLCVVLAATIMFVPAGAQSNKAPYWASLRHDTVNMRVGPSAEYPIDWVYKREGLPVKVVRLREGWRLVQDHEGTQGWIAQSQLSRDRGAVVIGEGLVDMRASPSSGSALRWRAEPGVVGKLKTCRDGACEIDVAGRTGWVSAERLWGSQAIN